MPNKIPADKIWQEWVRKANEDELGIKSILKHRDSSPNLVGFLVQQMAEKYLKGLLVYHTQNYPKIHHLRRIATLLEPLEKDIFDLSDEFSELSSLYVIDRYPGDMPELSWIDAEKAYDNALKIKNFVLSKIVETKK